MSSFQLRAELLTEIGPQQAARLIQNPNYGGQEKENGKRRIVVRNGNQVFCFNREGEKRNLPPAVVKIILQHHLTRFVIDTELCGTVIAPRVRIFDSLILGDELLGQQEYQFRLNRTHEEFDNFNPMFFVLYTARTPEEKLALCKKLYAENAEGMVFKRMDAIYKQGRAGQHFKLKFWKDADVVVIGPSPEGHDSVEIGVYKNGKLHRISGVSLIGRERVKAGDVITVKYLYATKNLHIVQPIMLQKRDDKQPKACTADQLVINRDMVIA
jgi:bifunctional non-homologous end joining protein LigD